MQATDENKRRVLGNVLNQIRFPVMDPDEFIKSVGSTRVLTSEESLDVILFSKGSDPHRPLNFPTSPRTAAWKDFFIENNKPEVQLVNVPTLKTRFSVQSRSNKTEPLMSSVYFINPLDVPIAKVTLASSEGLIRKVEKSYFGHSLFFC